MLSKQTKKYEYEHDQMFDLLSGYAEKRLKEIIKGKVYVIYSNFGSDSKGVPLNNLDEVAIHGTVKLYQKHEPYGNGKDYESDSIQNPTWLDLAKLANDMIKTTNDKHHIFFEGIHKYSNNKYGFSMGS